MRVVVFNLGCKVNQYECDVIRERLTALGHTVSEELSLADVYILNTCAVTAEAEKKSRQAVARCKKFNENAKIYVLGCASEKSPNTFEKEGVVYISGVAQKYSVVDRIGQNDFEQAVFPLPKEYETEDLRSAYRDRAFLKVQDGCNHFCSYCIIPYLRGRCRSKPLQNVLEEASRLSKTTKEIVLTGIDLMSYGIDVGSSFTELIRSIRSLDVRIRLGSVYAEQMTSDTLDALFSLRHFCPHFHLSLQSGDNDVLRAMNRRYTAEEYLQRIRLIRSYDARAGITTDVIVGFPTEDEDAFTRTCEFVQEAGFSDLHIFPFSPRTGTRAAKLTPLPKEIVSDRKHRMASLKQACIESFLQQNISKQLSVLIEEETEDGFRVGYSGNYIRVYTRQEGDVVLCTPTQRFSDGLKEV